MRDVDYRDKRNKTFTGYELKNAIIQICQSETDINGKYLIQIIQRFI